MSPPLRRKRKGPDARLTQQLDDTVRAIVKSLGHCERCGRSGDQFKLDWAHVEGRQNFRLRWCLRNSMCLCFLCHKWWHDFPRQSTAWFDQHRPADARYIDRVQNESGKRSVYQKRELLAELRALQDGLGLAA